MCFVYHYLSPVCLAKGPRKSAKKRKGRVTTSIRCYELAQALGMDTMHGGMVVSNRD